MLNKQNQTTRCILYYPNMLPSHNWLKQVLLYWDEVGTIVPNEEIFRESLQRLQDTVFHKDIRYLMEEGIFQEFKTEEFLKSKGNLLADFEKEFKQLLRSRSLQSILLAKSKEKNPLPSIRLHQSELPSSLLKILVKRGLAKSRKDDPSWYSIENTVGVLYLSIVAKYIAEQNSRFTVPSTDIIDYERLMFQTSSDTNGILSLKTLLHKVLPIPSEDTPIDKIVDFRRKRKDELLHFRQELLIYQNQLRECKEMVEAKDIILSYKENLARNIKELDETFRDANLKTVAGSMQTIIKLDSPALWATILTAASQTTQVVNLPLHWSLLGVSVLGMIEITTYLVDRRNEKRALLRNSPFAYVYHAEKSNIFKAG